MIIEGSDYIGGRVKQETFAGVTINLGANWVAPGDTPWIDLVLNEWEVDAYPMDWDSVVLRDDNGHVISDKEVDPVWDKFEIARIKTVDIAKTILDQSKSDISYRAAFQLGGWVARTPLEKIVEWYSVDFESAERSQVSSLLSYAFLNIEEDTYFVIDESGYNAIFDKIAPFLKASNFSNHVRLNQHVRKIHYNNVEKVVQVLCDDGTVYTGEHVLITFSIGVLQSDLLEINPGLPDWKVEELYQMHMVAYGSIFMQFPEKFWDDEQHLLHVSNRYNYFPYFINFDSLGSYLPNKTHILVAHIVGEEVWRIENQSDEATKDEIQSVLQNMFGLDSPPQATEFRVVTDWLQDPLTMGTYSNWPVDVAQECFVKLQSRVGPLFFGGEATDPEYNGYVYGAVRSGEREAKKILDCMGGRECPEYEPLSSDFFKENKRPMCQ